MSLAFGLVAVPGLPAQPSFWGSPPHGQRIFNIPVGGMPNTDLNTREK